MRYCGSIEIWNCAICCPIDVPGTTAVLASVVTPGTDDVPACCDGLTRDVMGKLDLATVREVNGNPIIIKN